MLKIPLKLTLESLKLLFKPLIRLCLLNGIGIQEITEVVKVCLVDIAKEEMRGKNEKINVSRLSVMTGLHRRDVMRLLDSDSESKEPLTLISRILGQWAADMRFKTKSGTPRVLTVDGNNSEFSKLVGTVSKDVHHGTILFELKRIGAIEHVKGGIKLIDRAQNVRSDPQKGYQILSADISDLIDATNENLFSEREIPNLHARTEYDNVFKEDLPKIRQWLLKEGSEFHQRVRTYIAKFDRDINPHINKEAGAKVSITAFSKIKE